MTFIFFLLVIVVFFFFASRESSSNLDCYSKSRDESDFLPTQTQFDVSTPSPVSAATCTIESDEFVLPDITCITRYCVYKVVGKNPETNRRKGDYVVAKEGAPEDIITSKTYLLAPYTVEKADKAPTDGQIECARKLNIPVPAHCTSADISCLITKYHEDSEIPYVSNGLVAFAGERDILISPYSSALNAVCTIMYYLDETDSLAFFIYVIYCVQESKPVENLDALSNKNAFYGLSKSRDFYKLVSFINSLSDEHIEYLFLHKRINCQGSNSRLNLYHAICDYITANIT